MTRWVWTFDDPAPHPLPASAVDLLQWEVVTRTEVEAWERIAAACRDVVDIQPAAAEMLSRARWHIDALSGEGTPCSENN